jgi:hypothetical protein
MTEPEPTPPPDPSPLTRVHAQSDVGNVIKMVVFGAIVGGIAGFTGIGEPDFSALPIYVLIAAGAFAVGLGGFGMLHRLFLHRVEGEPPSARLWRALAAGGLLAVAGALLGAVLGLVAGAVRWGAAALLTRATGGWEGGFLSGLIGVGAGALIGTALGLVLLVAVRFFRRATRGSSSP